MDESEAERKSEAVEFCPEDDEPSLASSAAEFEQLISSHPHSPTTWIAFIRFYLTQQWPKPSQRYELGKTVAERALKTITFQ